MRIALIGYGKMGHIIEQLSLQRGHQIVYIADVDSDNGNWDEAEVAIEFSTPATAQANVERALRAGKKVVCGTTGWDVEGFKQNHPEYNGQWIWKSNFSIGVNVLFELNKTLAQYLSPYPQYQPAIEEIHHIHKLDKPSGTAKTLAEEIESSCHPHVPITSIREGEIPGTHTITWDSPEDTIIIQHIAKGRQGFALGAIIAAEELTNH